MHDLEVRRVDYQVPLAEFSADGVAGVRSSHTSPSSCWRRTPDCWTGHPGKAAGVVTEKTGNTVADICVEGEPGVAHQGGKISRAWLSGL